MPILAPAVPPPRARSPPSSPRARRPLASSDLNGAAWGARPSDPQASVKPVSNGKTSTAAAAVKEQVKQVFAIMDEEAGHKRHESRASVEEDEGGDDVEAMEAYPATEEEDACTGAEDHEEGGDQLEDDSEEEDVVSMVVSHSQPTGLDLLPLLEPQPPALPAPPLQPSTTPDPEKPKRLETMDVEVVEILDSDDDVGADEKEVEGEDDEDEEMVSDVDSDEEDLRMQASPRLPLHIEVRLRPESTILYDPIRRAIGQYITGSLVRLETNAEVPGWRDYALFNEHVSAIRCESDGDDSSVKVSESSLHIHIYQPPPTDAYYTFSASLGDSGDTENDTNTAPAASQAHQQQQVQQGATDGDDVAASVLELPAGRLEGVWESLIYEGGVKSKLLDYIYSTVRFSEHDVDHNLISWHRLVLLHGPPGTGKTSLCRGLAQKLAIRLSATYDHARLVEINSHSLFSKWFSESGKLVQKLFQQVTDMVDDESCFVVVLIDEVESLTSARAGAMSGKEPSDALRVVNALLTQLDKLKQRKNVLVLTTSNLSAAIDPAFVDRADIKQYIGLPPTEAVYWILRSCVTALMVAGLVRTRTLLEYRAITAIKKGPPALRDMPPNGARPKRKRAAIEADKARKSSMQLLELAERCQGMSGRTLRRLPLLTDAKCSSARWSGEAVGVGAFLNAMATVIDEQTAAMDKMGENSC